MGLHPDCLPDPSPQRRPRRMALSALCVVLLAIAGAAAVFHHEAAPHAAAYAQAEPQATRSTTPPAPQQLTPMATHDPILATLAGAVVKGPAARIRSASVLCQVEVWTRHDNMMTAQRITSWRGEDGSGDVTTLTLPDIAASAFHPAMVGRTSFEFAADTKQTYGPGQMPHHSQWPPTLGTDPQTLLSQLQTIRPGIDTAADLN
ncbi:hypothetical protein Rhe02_14710 [Rhizocola hellebori]|uniref:Uncharacterized protein n=1 Tax=Rhizocola hellebori TaxID=1392758 RepID=A0A8J3Q438_9ACTN|nr:hypothetical protein [Rhizocola hellebori]GIH03404.1 hypothetical protein Rhe02_14710 [Rhizocola hellebori]